MMTATGTSEMTILRQTFPPKSYSTFLSHKYPWIMEHTLVIALHIWNCDSGRDGDLQPRLLPYAQTDDHVAGPTVLLPAAQNWSHFFFLKENPLPSFLFQSENPPTTLHWNLTFESTVTSFATSMHKTPVVYSFFKPPTWLLQFSATISSLLGPYLGNLNCC